MGKLVRTQKFCQNRLNHSFFLKGSYSHFLIWWIIRKLAFFSLFWGFSNGTLKVTPLVSTGKNCPTMVLRYIKKYYRKMSLVFPENSKNCPNHGLIEGAVMGRHVYSARWNWSRLLCKLPEFCNTQKIICLSFIDCSQFKFFWELRWKKFFDRPTLGAPPPTGPLTIRWQPQTYVM